MGRMPSAIFLIVVGAGLLALTHRFYLTGEVPAGVKGFRAYRPNRTDNPFAFYFFLALYYCGGMALLVWGILVLFGAAPGIRWR